MSPWYPTAYASTMPLFDNCARGCERDRPKNFCEQPAIHGACFSSLRVGFHFEEQLFEIVSIAQGVENRVLLDMGEIGRPGTSSIADMVRILDRPTKGSGLTIARPQAKAGSRATVSRFPVPRSTSARLPVPNSSTQRFPTRKRGGRRQPACDEFCQGGVHQEAILRHTGPPTVGGEEPRL